MDVFRWLGLETPASGRVLPAEKDDEQEGKETVIEMVSDDEGEDGTDQDASDSESLADLKRAAEELVGDSRYGLARLFDASQCMFYTQVSVLLISGFVVGAAIETVFFE